MDFLKSTLASAISKGPPFRYTFGDRVDIDNSIFALHNGTRREDGSNCSIFTFEINDSTRSRLPLARNAVRKLKTLRHPGVVKVLDSVETDTYIYIATERLVPLGWHVKCDALNTETIKWGLWSVATTLKFINEEASSMHGNVRTSTIFTSESGEWKLAGFDVLSSTRDDEPVVYRYGGLLPDAVRYAAPEVVKGGWDALRNQAVHVTDAWNFGTLIYEVYNAGAFLSPDQLPAAKKIPQNISAAYKRLVSINPKTRMSISQFLEQGQRQRSFFDTPLIHIAEFIENMGVKDQAEREEFLNELERTGDQFPEDFFKMKVLPELLKSVEFGGGGPKAFSVVLQIGDKLSKDQWETSIMPAVVRLFSLPDRATRVFLLENLPRMIEHLSSRVVNDKIFPNMLISFSDVAPIVREQTVKAVLTVVPKLSDRNINGELLKHLAKTQNDEQPGIRTNTTICLGKIARHLGQSTRNKVLMAAFSRSLHDPFIHARNAALLALAATADVFNETDCASKLVPAIAPALIDKESLIRTQASKTLNIYIGRIKELTADYPDTEQPPADARTSKSDPVPRMSTPADTGWAGWAISSFTKKIGGALPGGAIESKDSLAPAIVLQPTVTAAPEHPAGTPAATAAVPVRRTIPGRAASSSFASSSTVAVDDNDDAGDWGAMEDADDADVTLWDSVEPDRFFDAPLLQETGSCPVGCNSAPHNTGNGVTKTTTTTLPAKQSNFGPKTFTLSRGGDDDDIDFEALVKGGAAAKKKALLTGLARESLPTAAGKGPAAGGRASMGGVLSATTRKTLPLSLPPPKKDVDEDDADAWGDGWDG